MQLLSLLKPQKVLMNLLICQKYEITSLVNIGNIFMALREKCQNTEFFLVRIVPYSDWIRENTDQNNSKYGHVLRSDNSCLFTALSQRRIKKQSPIEVLQKDVLENFARFTGKYLCRRICFKKVAGLWPADFATFSRAYFL